MKIQSLPVQEVFKSLNTSGSGLTRAEAASRLLEYGPNEIRDTAKKPLYNKILPQFTHFLAVLLWVAAGLCFLSGWMHPGEGMYSLGTAIVVVIVVNAVFSLVQELKAERAVEALRRLLPFKAFVIRDGEEMEVPSGEVAPGDILVLREGDKIPADARLVSSARLMVNNSSLTGESGGVPRDHGPFDGTSANSPNIVYAGTFVLSGSGVAAVYATGMYTEFGKIAHLTGAVEPGLTTLQKEIRKATRIVATIAVTVGILFFALGLAVGMSFWHNFLFAVGIILANVPEGLLPTVTLSLAMGSQRMAKKKALVKCLDSVETLGSVTVICTDKTGTLTLNRMEAGEVWSSGRDERALMRTGMLCNNASYRDGEYRGDPTETAILKKAKESLEPFASRRVDEIPFDPDRKMMTTVDRLDGMTVVSTKGAVEMVLGACRYMLLGDAEAELDERARASVMDAARKMMDDGLRVIAFAYREMPESEAEGAGRAGGVEEGLVFCGLMGLSDPPRPEVPEAIAKCRASGIRVVMITGDASRTAAAIARKVGLAAGGARVVEGLELDGMHDGQLHEVLRGEVIFSRMAPRQKLRVVTLLKDAGERVAVTGDGVNDAPSLKKADIGIAMGVVGTDVARESADMILLDDNFATIVSAVEEGRTIFANIRKFISYIFAHLTPEAVPYILFSLVNIPLPLTVMQIIAIDLGTETIPALALGVEPPEPGVLGAGGGKSGRRLIDRPLLVRSYLFLGLFSAAAVLTSYFFVLWCGGWHWGASLPEDALISRQAATATFLGIVVMQVGNVFACRSVEVPLARMGLFSNRLILAGVAAELLLSALIVYHPLGNRVFGTAPVGLAPWLIPVPFCMVLVAVDEMRKRARAGKR